ncbi:3-oxoacyl-ACP reductase [Kocuria varians]|uniref:3-oxoacyl-ACP reductase n=1 Tax=Kocuria varians TaxID=1272 RepID=A0A4Y4DAC7_KOCVA|nr:3-oxoacyl-ACP reductase [Kocuria varians]GEC99700.1 3-oxoacyl-ACP reductase [Kocuria varians]
MTDTYLDMVNSGLGKQLASKLGLPRPVTLRRFKAGADFPDGSVLVLGKGRAGDAAAKDLLAWNLDVRRTAQDVDRVGAVVIDYTEAESPAQLGGPALELASALRKLRPGGRVITLSRPALGIGTGAASGAAGSEALSPAVSAARQGAVGILRSVAQEMRGGVTANGVLIADGVAVDAPSVTGAIRFFLSGRSAYVDGQFLTVGDDRGDAGLDWDHPVAGKVAVVTGAARGIGEQVTRTLAASGATVIPVDVPMAGDALTKLANELRVPALQLDVTDPQAGQKILDLVTARYGRLDLVVHNAGITRDKMLANMDQAKWDSVIAVNIESQLRINETLLASEDLGAAPRIVCLASTSGVAGNRGQTNYAASKAGVIGLVAATAPLIAAKGGTINAVAPGFIESDMTAKIPAARRQISRRLNSLQQGGLPVDVAQAITFLLSDAAGGINGQTLRVCGQSLVGA